jgi:hypothetical protein
MASSIALFHWAEKASAFDEFSYTHSSTNSGTQRLLRYRGDRNGIYLSDLLRERNSGRTKGNSGTSASGLVLTNALVVIDGPTPGLSANRKLSELHPLRNRLKCCNIAIVLLDLFVSGNGDAFEGAVKAINHDWHSTADQPEG